MGGVPPLGYQVWDRRLVVVAAIADKARAPAMRRSARGRRRRAPPRRDAGQRRRPGPWARPYRAGLGHRARGLCWRRTGGLALGDPASCRWCGRDLGRRRLRPWPPRATAAFCLLRPPGPDRRAIGAAWVTARRGRRTFTRTWSIIFE